MKSTRFLPKISRIFSDTQKTNQKVNWPKNKPWNNIWLINWWREKILSSSSLIQNNKLLSMAEILMMMIFLMFLKVPILLYFRDQKKLISPNIIAMDWLILSNQTQRCWNKLSVMSKRHLSKILQLKQRRKRKRKRRTRKGTVRMTKTLMNTSSTLNSLTLKSKNSSSSKY